MIFLWLIVYAAASATANVHTYRLASGSDHEVIALGFRAGVQTVSQSTTDRCGYGDYYEFKLPDKDDDHGGVTGMTDPPLPPGCCSSKA